MLNRPSASRLNELEERCEKRPRREVSDKVVAHANLRLFRESQIEFERATVYGRPDEIYVWQVIETWAKIRPHGRTIARSC